MEAFLHPLQGLAEFGEIKKRCGANCGILNVSGCMESQKVHLMYGLSGLFPYHLILADDERNAKEIYEDYRFYDKNVYFYPAKDLLFFQADIHGNLLIRQRMRVIRALLEQEEVTVVTSIDGCMDFLMPLEKIRSRLLHFKSDSVIDLDQLKEELVELGYERTGQVELPGQFSVRGGIIDVYPLTEDNPWGIELWDDEVDSIRSFDAQSQRSMENLEEITLYPAAELSPDQQGYKGESLLDYIKGFRSLVFLDESNRLLERGETVEKEYRQSFENRMEKGQIAKDQPEEIIACEVIWHKLNQMRGAALSTLEATDRRLEIHNRYRLDTRSIQSYNNHFELLVKDLKRWKKEKYRVVLMCASRTRGRRLAEDLLAEELSAFYSEDETRVTQPGEIMVTHGNVYRGYEYPMIRFAVISETDVFGKEKKKKHRKQRSYEGTRIGSFSDLNVGDYVVHENHGLGIYRGIEKITVDKTVKDYMKIEYSKGSCLYILATQLDAIQKYSSADGEKVPKLNSLGGQDWKKTKTRVRSAVQLVAKDLVELYAARQSEKGYVYGPDTVWQKEFEELFPYEETTDQLNAIEDTKHDMESRRVMDRLICGDVGYGKTEIAIRAAFKAVQEGKQVAYLVPTTVLASQHFTTFEQRMKDFPVTVAQLSSFRTSAQNKETIEELKKGMVDIVIGTHRLLSKDVVFKDLGLLIIDEEQRFGVTHKEKIKKLKNNVDVLTLSATPIPRTLHMSLAGIRDMSVLEEPPIDRVPIQTFVTEHNDEMIREAITRELARNGQVYYVYNRVRSIDEAAAHIQELVPDANVAYAHGQMAKRELEKIMCDFVNGDIDVLVSTTIIETGMDISNCNTMIIEDADRFGLSQLYQLRGRVGRSSRTAYAFLLYRRDKVLTEVAEKRLSVIREFADFGSGFKIAMKDLEIRGAGNVLGNSQHGHMAAVGYDLYCKMLNQAVNNLKGIKNEYEFETTIDVDVDAYIPATYIKSEYQKLDIYKRIAALENMDELSDMKDELSDRYGSVPSCADNLLMIALIKSKAHKLGMIEIKGGVTHQESGTAVWRTVMTVYPKAELDPDAIKKLLDEYGGAIQMRVDANPAFIWTVTKKKFTNAKEYLNGLNALMDVFIERLMVKS